jgi:histidinol phosphatase-like PHP family hydrolase
MRYIVDHDFHLHSQLSRCSKDPLQTPEALLAYAEENGLKKIVLTDHFWDASIPRPKNHLGFYDTQDFAHIASARPLPQSEKVWFGFGGEADIDKRLVIGVSEELCKEFDFLMLSTTHAHMVAPKTMSVPDRALFYIQRFETLLDSNMPFEKMGIAHPTCPLIDNRTWDNHMQVYDMIPDEIFAELFQRSAEKGLGIELNFPIFKYSDADLERIVRPYRIAKACGCKFYFGSDAHHPAQLAEAKKRFEYTVDVLGLEESDKFLLK